MKQVLKLLPFLNPYRFKSFLSLALLVIVVVLDLAIPRLVQRIIDQGIFQQNYDVVLNTFFIMLGISILNTFFSIGNNIYSVQAGEGVARDLREAIFLKIQSFSYGNLDQLKTGQLMVRLTSDVSVLQRLVHVSLRIGTRAPLLMIGSLFLMFSTNRSLALSMLPLLGVTSGIILFFIFKMRPLFMTMQLKLDKLNTILQENIAGVRVVKAFERSGYEGERFYAGNQDFTDSNIRVMQFVSTLGPVLSAFVNIGIVAVIWVGGLQSISGNATAGEIVAFINYLQTTLGPLMIMVNLTNIWAAAIVSAERVNEVLDAEPQVRDQPDARPLPAAIQPRIVFENVSFHYNASQDHAILKGVNLTAEAGETVAILGATGAGKTSLVNLIPRFYDVSEGRVLLDGMDLRELQQDALIGIIGVVPQETVLFSGSVRDNIRYGRPYANDEDVIAAAKAAQAHDFIQKLPRGYDTHVEERGVNLSGGQKQRIAIARALLTHPKILILDDSTSSVDVETEGKIQAAFAKSMGECTTFMVAQRISTVLQADKIVVIDKGKIAAQGTHRQLLESSQIYQEIYASQLGDGNHRS
jgi:ATP-binding cassette subfamily B protein